MDSLISFFLILVFFGAVRKIASGGATNDSNHYKHDECLINRPSPRGKTIPPDRYPYPIDWSQPHNHVYYPDDSWPSYDFYPQDDTDD